jgi:hypothetical protein
MKAFVHPAAVMMVLTDSFAVFAAEFDAALVLCAWKILVSIPALSRTVFSHLAMVSVVTGLCGCW